MSASAQPFVTYSSRIRFASSCFAPSSTRLARLATSASSFSRPCLTSRGSVALLRSSLSNWPHALAWSVCSAATSLGTARGP